VVVTRNVPLTQVTNYQNNASIDAETIESSFDKLVHTAQQLDDGNDYSFKFASNISGTTGFDSNADTATTLNSDKSARASKALRFDSDGNVGISVHDPDELATIATTQANSAILKASEAAVSASSASTSENNASASATSASASAANAATSETNAFGYKNSAAASAASASASAIAMAIALGLILTPLLS
jgi:thiol:disulfide interchange protein